MTGLGAGPFDVAYVGDFRSGSRVAPLAADEIALHAKLGYSTLLVPLVTWDGTDRDTVHPSLDALVRSGHAAVAADEKETPTAGLVLIHDPASLAEDRPPGRQVPRRLSARQGLVIANEPPADLSGAASYDFDRVEGSVREITGCTELTWAPAWPNVRSQLEAKAHKIAVAPFDWAPVVDPDRWFQQRRAQGSLTPTVGRHGWPDPADWPEDLKVFLSRYPVSRHLSIRLLGVYPPVLSALRRTPRNWTVFPFGSIAPERFLRSLDYFVYHPGWRRRATADRTILEAMACGAVPVLPEELRPAFGEAALYPEDGRDALEIMVTLFRDREAFAVQLGHGQALVRDAHGPAVHGDRLKALLGAPARKSESQPPVQAAGRMAKPQRTPILFVSSNGIGLGHLSRLLAIAKRMDDAFQPVFATMSQGLSVVRAAGYHAEHLPHHFYAGCDPDDWNDWLRLEVSRLLQEFGARGLVYDGGSPYRGVSEAVANTPDVKAVWCRRAMWRDALWDQAIEQAKFVDLVIEPGELAAPNDIGATVAHRQQARPVEPIMLLDEEDLLSREEARQRLGLRADRPAVLLQLGSGNHVSLVPAIERMLDTMERQGELQPVIAEWMIAERSLDHWPQVPRLTGFPNVRYVRAFDFVISSTGYNAFHELLSFGVPTLFVPIEVSYLDNQMARAAYAEEQGMALSLRLSDMKLFPDALQRLCDPDERAGLVAACRQQRRPNGAGAAAALIAELVG